MAYSAYRIELLPLSQVVDIVANFGLLYWLPLVGGAALSVLNPRSRPAIVFCLVQTLILVVAFLRIQGFTSNHLYLLLPALMLPVIGFWSTVTGWLEKRAWLHGAALFAMTGLATLNCVQYFFPEAAFAAAPLRAVLAPGHYFPERRRDVGELRRLLDVLQDHVTNPTEGIYVLASSALLNSHMLQNARLVLDWGGSVSKQIWRTHDVDLRDGFPRQFFEASWLVVANPVQFHLLRKDQQVIGVLADAVIRGEGFGSAYEALPVTINLDHGVEVHVYRKTRAITAVERGELAETFRRRYPDVPALYEF